MQAPLIYDTTLRDGTQGESISFSAKEKVDIAKRLDDLGVHYIEGGWPGSNPKDLDFFKRIRNVSLTSAKITAFGATRKPFSTPRKDPCLNALLRAETKAVALFGKSWTLHISLIARNTLKENLSMIQESVAYLKQKGREVIYDAEHFFDGFKDNADYALETLLAAWHSGADFLVLCDTNGGTLPFEMERIFKQVKEALRKRNQENKEDVKLGIHAHNDCGLAVANSITAVQMGAEMVQGTVNGYGERCGNADITTLIPVLCSKMNLSGFDHTCLPKLKSLSRFVSERANMTPLNTQPFVGRSAFAHKGGVHVSAVMKNPKAYEHITPDLVGNKRRVLVSDLSGKSNVSYKINELNIPISEKSTAIQRIVDKIKRLEHKGYQFDTADGSLKILAEKLTNQFHSFFDLESFRVNIEKNKNKPCLAHATMKISVGNKIKITAAEGNGPVSALDNALREALIHFFPESESMQLVDYKVRVIDGEDGTSSKVRVFIESRDQNEIWSTIGVSEDIIEASWQALSDSFQYKLSKELGLNTMNDQRKIGAF